MRSPAPIPSTMHLAAPVKAVLDPLIENVEVICGQRGVKLERLGPSATTSEIINAFNSLLDMLQGQSR